MGGGSGSGAISHSAYMEMVHKDLLGLTAGPAQASMNRSIVQVMNTALTAGSSPFLGTSTYNPDGDISRNQSSLDTFQANFNALDFLTNPNSVLATVFPAITLDVASTDVAVLDTTTSEATEILDTTTLDVATLDVAALDVALLDTPLVFTTTLDTATLPAATLDTFVVSTAQVNADVDAFSAILEADLNQLTLPRFKAGMLNIGAVVTSAFVIGESLLRAEKLRQVSQFTAELRYKLFMQADEINARFMTERREIDSKFRLQFEELTARFKVQQKDKVTEYNVLNQSTAMQYNIQFRELTTRYKLQFAELTSRYKLQFQEISARFKIEFMQTTAKYKIQHKDKVTDYQLQHRDLSAKFKLQFQELTAAFKNRAQDINMQFKNQRQTTVRHMISESLKILMDEVRFSSEWTRLSIEANRLRIIAKSEQAQEQLLINEHNARWDLEVFSYGTAVLGGIGGGALIPGKKSKAALLYIKEHFWHITTFKLAESHSRDSL